MTTTTKAKKTTKDNDDEGKNAKEDKNMVTTRKIRVVSKQRFTQRR